MPSVLCAGGGRRILFAIKVAREEPAGRVTEEWVDAD
ncbi:MAG: hypothetical protein EWM73_03720 [Nitrospira sp.]|nr:MAG: hypothetical protein EWM73_03720 [Nitrospira sp.]